MTSSRPLRLGTRGSQLAMVQANQVARQLTAWGQPVEIVIITTAGDRSTAALAQAGGIGMFTKALQQALVDERIDFAVHSLKDLPTEPAGGVALVATPPRAACEDVLVTRDGMTIDRLPGGCRVGTGSPRRRAQLLHLRSDLDIVDLRGNVDSRLDKLHRGQYDAIVLAAAGLTRLELLDPRWQILSADQMLPAVGQGALGLEARAVDEQTADQLAALNHPPTWSAVTAERALLARLTAGCLAPVGAWARETSAGLRLDAAVLSADGNKRLGAHIVGNREAADELGIELADRLLADGAAPLIEDGHHS